MILCPVGPNQTAYRLHRPRWSVEPLSGAGAGRSGGRLNRPGVDALYVAYEEPTAIAEYRQDDPLVRPGLLVAYRLTLRNVVDFSRGFDPGTWAPIWQDLSCNWKRMAFYEGIEPPSWAIADLVRSAGHAGILYPSMRNPRGLNLVIYPDLLTKDDRIEAFDPAGDLPSDQSSWN